MLIEFIQNQNEGPSNEVLNKFQEIFENSRRRRIKPKLSQEDPSFICYKSTDEKERPKINKMVNLSQSIKKNRGRSKTEVRENPLGTFSLTKEKSIFLFPGSCQR